MGCISEKPIVKVDIHAIVVVYAGNVTTVTAEAKGTKKMKEEEGKFE